MDLSRLELIMDENNLNQVKSLNIVLIGLGGVGGACFEALVRLGIENITVIDNDVFETSNLNRQILSNINNIGNNKTDEAIKRAKAINPNINITGIKAFINIDSLSLLNGSYDFIIDACDTITTKALLIEYALNNGIKIITCCGTGNKFHPEYLTITTLDKTINDPLSKDLRKMLRNKNITTKIPCVWSPELPIKTNSTTVGSNVLVPNTAGLLLASYVINNTIKK